MKLNELSPNDGATHNSKRVGRGIGSGKGKTCGKGQKGQKARSGVAINGFEGGQMPLYQRLPKRGFNNVFAKDYAVVSIDRLQALVNAKKITAKDTIDLPTLVERKLVKNAKDGLKVIGNGDLSAKLNVKAVKATKGAREAIEQAGGKVETAAPIENKENA